MYYTYNATWPKCHEYRRRHDGGAVMVLLPVPPAEIDFSRLHFSSRQRQLCFSCIRDTASSDRSAIEDSINNV